MSAATSLYTDLCYRICDIAEYVSVNHGRAVGFRRADRGAAVSDESGRHR
jgi:hypothetical protein